MSDCCWTKVLCRPEHRKLFEDIGFDDEDLPPPDLPGVLALVDDSANYANETELRELAEKRIPFIAEHGPGGEWGDGWYVSDGSGVMLSAECIDGRGPAVEVGEDGEPDKDQLKDVRLFYAMEKSAKAVLAGPAAPPSVPPGKRWLSADEILKAMDPALFREQRRRLLALIEGARRSTTGPISAADVDLLDGLESMLADLADFAHDVLGMDCLLEESEPESEGDG